MSDARAIGIVGCGAIGGALARAVDIGLVDANLAAVCDTVEARAEALAKSLRRAKPQVMELDALLRRVNLVVECAGPDVAAMLAETCPKAGRDLMAMSVGGIRREHFAAFRDAGCSLYIPSGAVCGLDGIQAAALGDVESVTLTTRKPPAALKGAPGVNDAELDSLKEERALFEGSAEEAVKLFPKNVNVASTLALAADAGERFTVKVVADPNVKNNIHEISLRGALGGITVRVENIPSPQNPRTSALAVYSAIATLRKICASVKLGT